MYKHSTQEVSTMWNCWLSGQWWNTNLPAPLLVPDEDWFEFVHHTRTMAKPAGPGCSAQPTQACPCSCTADLDLLDLGGRVPPLHVPLELSPLHVCLGLPASNSAPHNHEQRSGSLSLTGRCFVLSGCNFFMVGIRLAGCGDGRQCRHRVNGCQCSSCASQQGWGSPNRALTCFVLGL